MTAGSAGNHAQALAFAARHFGVPCDIFVPAGAPITKIEACRAYGATVVEGGASLDEAMAAARARAAEHGMAFCHPFDDPAVVAGQGTLGLELVEDLPDLSCVIVPVGGGGLAAGRRDRRQVAAAARPGHRRAGRRCARRTPAGRRPPGPSSRSPTASPSSTPGELTGPLSPQWVDELVAVDEDAIADAMVLLMDRAKLYVEGAGAVGVAALSSGLVAPAPSGTTCVVLSGGNVDLGIVPGPDPPPRDQGRAAPRRVRPHRRPARAAWCACSARSPPPAPTSSRSSTSARASTCTSARPASTPRSRCAAATTPSRSSPPCAPPATATCGPSSGSGRAHGASGRPPRPGATQAVLTPARCGWGHRSLRTGSSSGLMLVCHW